MALGQNQWYHFGVDAPPILEPLLVVGLECSLGGTIRLLTHHDFSRESSKEMQKSVIKEGMAGNAQPSTSMGSTLMAISETQSP